MDSARFFSDQGRYRRSVLLPFFSERLGDGFFFFFFRSALPRLAGPFPLFSFFWAVDEARSIFFFFLAAMPLFFFTDQKRLRPARLLSVFVVEKEILFFFFSFVFFSLSSISAQNTHPPPSSPRSSNAPHNRLGRLSVFPPVPPSGHAPPNRRSFFPKLKNQVFPGSATTEVRYISLVFRPL